MSKFHFLKKSSFIIVVMIVCLLAATCVVIASTSNSGVAYADNNYDLWIADVRVTSTNLSGDGWSYEPSTNTLSLNNYLFYNQTAGIVHYAPIYYGGNEDFFIEYTGTNNIIRPYMNGSTNIVAGIFSAANLTINGTGSNNMEITVNNYTSAYSYGIQVQGKLTINSGSMSITTGDASSQSIGIYCQTNGGFEFNANYLRIEPGVSSTTNAYAIYNEGSAVIQAGTVYLKAKSTSADSYAYYGSSSNTSLTVKSVVEYFEAAGVGGVTAGAGGGIKNNISGYWYPATTGADGETGIAKSDTPQTYPSAKRITFSTPYMSVDTNQPEIFYDGQPHSPIITVSKPTAGYTIKWGTEYGVYNLDTAPSYTNAGEYYVYYKITADGYMSREGSIDFVIQKGEWEVYTIPTVKENLKYTGEPIELVNPGSAEDTMIYTLLDSNWDYVQPYCYSEQIPKATAVGSYWFYYEVEADENHELYEGNFEIIIAKGDIVLDVEPTPVDNLVYSGQAQQLIHPGSLQGKTVYYKLGESGEYSENIPTATEVGIYTIYYKVEGDENYNDFESHLDAEIARLKREIQDPTSSVSIEINGEDINIGFDENISLKVEVKTNVSVQEGTTDYAAIQKMLNSNEKINGVYDVKLILTVDGVETEIQPSDIKEGTIITVKMKIPNGVDSSSFRLLHIHAANDMEFINNYTVNGDTISFEISRLSEFAFVVKDSVSSGSYFPGWAIALIVLGGVLVLGCACFFLLFFVLNKWINKDDKAVRALKIGKKDDKVKLMLMNFSIEYRVKAEVFDSKKEAEEE